MKIKIYEDRRLLNEKENFGSQYENLATTLIFEFPEYVEKDGIKLATKDLNKTIIFNIEDDNELPIIEDKFSFPYDITKLGEVEWNIALKEKSETEDMTDKLIWYSETMVSKFEKTNEGKNEITTEKLDSFNVITTVLNEKIAEVEALKVDIGDFKQALDSKVDKEQGKGLSTNDFTNILKEKLENLENYNDEEIRNLLNGSLKEVEYSANDGIMTFTKNDGSEIKVDLPLELLIESGRYDETNSQIVLVLANGNSINIPVSDLLDDFYGKNETYNKTEVDNLILQKQRQIEALENEIDDLIEENLAQQEEIDMLTADYRENTIEGETVVISDGLPKSKIKATVNGNSYQFSTEGYQLLNVNFTDAKVNGIDFKNKKQVIEIKGTTTASTNIEVGRATLPAGNYTISCSNLLYAWATSRIEMSGTGIETVGFYSGESTKTITLSQETELVFRAIVSGTGTSVNYSTTIMLESGSTAHPWEPYTNGASPNIEYPQEVEVVEGVNRFNPNNVTNVFIQNDGSETPNNSAMCTDYIEAKGKVLTVGSNINWFDIASFYDKDKNFISREMISAGNTEDEIEFRTFKRNIPSNAKYVKYCCSVKTTKPMLNFINYNKYIPYGHIGLVQRKQGLFNGEFRYGSYSQTDREDRLFSTQSLKLETNKTYSILTNLDLSIYKYAIALAEKTFPTYPILYDSGWQTQQTFSFTPTTEGYFGVGITRLDGKALTPEEMANYYFIVDETENATDLEPIVKPINLEGNSLAKVGDVKDLLNIKSNGEVNIEKKTNRQIFDGSNDEVWHLGTIKDITQVFSAYLNRKYKPNVIHISNRFMKSVLGDTEKFDFGGVNQDEVYIAINKTRLEEVSATGFKKWLSENPVHILYAIAEPTTIPLPSISPITLFEGTNVFELVTNLGTTMAVTYKVSNKSLDKRISALESALIGG